MVDHFAAIGFRYRTDDELRGYIRSALKEGEVVPAGDGRYVKWPADQPAQLWVQVDRKGKVGMVTPHFSGHARMRVALTARVTRPGDKVLEGAFHGWADPKEGVEGGEYPFVFDTPDYQTYRALELPALVEVQLSAFAHKVDAYADEAVFHASQQGLKIAAESFIPAGLISPGKGATDPPQARAIFAGRVLDAAPLTNRVTGATFQWAMVRTLGGVVEIVAQPELLGASPGKGEIIRGTFWLSGRLQEYPRPSGRTA